MQCFQTNGSMLFFSKSYVNFTRRVDLGLGNSCLLLEYVPVTQQQLDFNPAAALNLCLPFMVQLYTYLAYLKSSELFPELLYILGYSVLKVIPVGKEDQYFLRKSTLLNKYWTKCNTKINPYFPFRMSCITMGTLSHSCFAL